MMIGRRLSILLVFVGAGAAFAQTGTFLDRQQAGDLRLMSYNVEFDTIFSDTSPSQAPKIARLIKAVNPDILTLQEIYDHSAAQVATLMNSILPLPGGASWNAHKGFDNVIVSKYPLSMTRTTTVPHPPSTTYSIALVDLPDAQYSKDFYFMNGHFKCCGGFDYLRQEQADALVNWMRDARTPGGSVNLPAGTPMAVVGDFNIVESLDPLNTLITGDIFNNTKYGPDSAPDWDNTSLADSRPLHNAVGPDDYTWRDDSSIYNPGRLDFVLYTDSVITSPRRFILNTTTMSSADLAATGLQQLDSANSPGRFDHLPLIVDFRFPVPQILGDYNSDGFVNDLDFAAWQSTFGQTVDLHADGNGNGIVDAADYVVWREQVSGLGATANVQLASVPEPATWACLSLAAVTIWLANGRSSRARANFQLL